MTIPGGVIGAELDTGVDFVDELRSLDEDQLDAIRVFLSSSPDPDAPDALQRVKRVITEAEGLAEDEAEAAEGFEDDGDAAFDQYDDVVQPLQGKRKKPKSARGKGRKPAFTTAEFKELDAVAREFASNIRLNKPELKNFRDGDAVSRRKFLKDGITGNKMGDVVERVGEAKVHERAVAQFGEKCRVWSSTKLQLLDNTGTLTGDYEELDFMILDAADAVVGLVSAKTSPTAVAPGTDRLHLTNYYTFPADLSGQPAKLQLSRALNLQKITLQNKVEFYFQYTEAGSIHSMPLAEFRIKHPLKLASTAETPVVGLTPFSTARLDTNPILLGLDEDELFAQLIKLILAALDRPAPVKK